VVEVPEIGELELTLHGHRVRYLQAGSGPVLALIHGITSTADTWVPAMAGLCRDHTVIAPDLIGHGASAKPRGDYSLGAYASGVRDLLATIASRSSGTRSAAGPRCSSPTSTPSAPSGWPSSPQVASGVR
jgi:alpha-beta hydrolase superfamily lysophospholipase